MSPLPSADITNHQAPPVASTPHHQLQEQPQPPQAPHQRIYDFCPKGREDHPHPWARPALPFYMTVKVTRRAPPSREPLPLAAKHPLSPERSSPANQNPGPAQQGNGEEQTTSQSNIALPSRVPGSPSAPEILPSQQPLPEAPAAGPSNFSQPVAQQLPPHQSLAHNTLSAIQSSQSWTPPKSSRIPIPLHPEERIGINARIETSLPQVGRVTTQIYGLTRFPPYDRFRKHHTEGRPWDYCLPQAYGWPTWRYARRAEEERKALLQPQTGLSKRELIQQDPYGYRFGGLPGAEVQIKDVEIVGPLDVKDDVREQNTRLWEQCVRMQGSNRVYQKNKFRTPKPQLEDSDDEEGLKDSACILTTEDKAEGVAEDAKVAVADSEEGWESNQPEEKPPGGDKALPWQRKMLRKFFKSGKSLMDLPKL